MEFINVNRRRFLKLTGVATGGLVLGWHIPGFALPSSKENPQQLNAYLQISEDNQITLFAPNPEIGQGVKTSLPMIVAEELDADWSLVSVQQSAISKERYKRQAAGGSRSVQEAWKRLREAGATAKLMLQRAAAQYWSVPVNECIAEAGHMIHQSSGRSLSYGALAKLASEQEVPHRKELKLKATDQFKLLGKRIGGVDNHALVTGEPLFGIDQHVPNMLYATYVKAPAVGGRPKSANLDEVKKLSGVKDAFFVEGLPRADQLQHGVAIVTTSTWAAFKARQVLKVEWDNSEALTDSTDELLALAMEKAKATASGPYSLLKQGDAAKALQQADKSITSYYQYPYLAHAPLEPINCTAWFKGDSLEVWAPSQTPQGALRVAANLAKLSTDQVTIHQTRIGGGFGRRLANDYVLEVVAIALKVKGPVHYISTREEDTTHDLYRPGAVFRISGGLDKEGKLSAWQEHFVSIGGNPKAKGIPGRKRPDLPAPMLKDYELSQSLIPSKIPQGWLRAPISNGVAFPLQSFLHELAVEAGRDHLEFLLEVLGKPQWLGKKRVSNLHTGRAAAVIKKAAELADWGRELEPGKGLGLAFYFSHLTYAAEVVEVTVSKDKAVTVDKVFVAVDAGTIVNLSGAEAQCQGSVVDALGVAMGQEITFQNGVVEQSNFHDYPLLRMPATPEISVHFIESDYAPTGLGEPVVPPLAPALCNAIFAAAGDRIYQLPITKQGYRQV